MDIQLRGRITTWKDDKGFGFITPDTTGPNVFFHIRDIVDHNARPSTDMIVFYTLTQDVQNRPRALNVRFAHPPRKNITMSLSITMCFVLILTFITWYIPLPIWVPVLYLLSSIFTYGSYALDKSSARQGRQRISEQTLHILELCGGWPGALIAQDAFRHKTVKATYQNMFWICVACNLLGLIGYSLFCFLIRTG